MRSNLEKAIVHLLNEEQGKAEEFFHKFMVERARQIHESLRQGEDAMLADESWDEEMNEEFFSETDLEDAEQIEGDDLDAAADDVSADLDVDADTMGDEEVADGEMADDADMGDDFGDEDFGDETAEGDVEGRIADLESQLETLTAEFETLMAEMDPDGDETTEGDAEDMGDEMGDMDGDVADMGDLGDEVSSEVEDDMTDEDGDEDEVKEGKLSITHEDEDDFDDITESVLAELEKVNLDATTDGKEVGAGKSFEQNRNTGVGNRKTPAKPVKRGEGEHTSFERETAPAVKDMKARKNTRKSAMDDMPKVSKEGDSKAHLNKDFAK